MRVIEQSAELLYFPSNVTKTLEDIARVSHASGDLARDGGSYGFVKKLIEQDPSHLSVLDHEYARAKFVTSRGTADELLRHRIGVGWMVESTRYCNYSKERFGKQLTFIQPHGIQYLTPAYTAWESVMRAADFAYNDMVNVGTRPEIARGVLPLDIKTTVVLTATFTAWKHIGKLRLLSKRAHPQLRALLKPLYTKFADLCPAVFGEYAIEEE